MYVLYNTSVGSLPVDIQQSVLFAVSHGVFLRLQFPYTLCVNFDWQTAVSYMGNWQFLYSTA